MIALWILLGIAINQLVAYFVFNTIDDEQRSLFTWWCSGPAIGKTLVTQLWPLTVFFWLRRRRAGAKP